MADVTIANIAGGEDTAPANTAKVEIEVGGGVEVCTVGEHP